jgi:hypothetical protein
MKDMAPFAAQSFFEHDIGQGMGNSFTSLSGEEDFLSLVRIYVAGLAAGYGFDVLDNLVLNLEVTEVAFDFVGEDMGRVHEVGFFILVQPFGFPMALEAIFARHISVADDSLAMAFVAAQTSLINQSVVKF